MQSQSLSRSMPLGCVVVLLVALLVTGCQWLRKDEPAPSDGFFVEPPMASNLGKELDQAPSKWQPTPTKPAEAESF